MEHLRAIWNELTSGYTSNNALVDTMWFDIERRYCGKNRYYHNLSHLEYMVEKAIVCKQHLTDFDIIMFSIFYHDIIYNISRKDNEEKSADFAVGQLNRLGVSIERIANCKRQILATKEHATDKDEDTNYLIDFDLAILGDTPEKYQKYTDNIRKEYSIFPNFLYKRGRRKVIGHFLSSDRIFKTAMFYQHYEQQARKNLAMELKKLV
ncbi:MAG: hypothetical protein RLO81_14350 [Fulvivirga sp.]|uniref:HD domain-containing protein n=1 Tax=Fulvivirga sp. TaxID=1931237 RepID=UPI0032EBE309